MKAGGGFVGEAGGENVHALLLHHTRLLCQVYNAQPTGNGCLGSEVTCPPTFAPGQLRPSTAEFHDSGKEPNDIAVAKVVFEIVRMHKIVRKPGI